MKSIDVKSLLIGFLLCATFFLSVGAKPASDGVGTYQLAGDDGGRLLDTRSGQVYVAFRDSKGWSPKKYLRFIDLDE